MFVTAYIHSFNATQSTIGVGYSERAAKQQGNRLLTNVYVKEKFDLELKCLRERMADEGSRAFARLLTMLMLK